MAGKRAEWIGLREGGIFTSGHTTREDAVAACAADKAHAHNMAHAWTGGLCDCSRVRYSVGQYTRRGITGERTVLV